MRADKKIKVAICGGGIAGLCLLYGLLKHDHLDVTLYEASPEVAGDEGAGVVLSPNAIRALRSIAQELVTAAENADSVFVSDPMATAVMGREPGFGNKILDLRSKTGERGFLFQRSKFIQQLFKLVPPSACKTSHKLASIARQDDGTLDLSFTDGTTTSVDVVIGGDGVHSTVRKHVLEDFPDQIEPFFSKQYFYVTMAPMEKAKEKMRDWFPKLPIQYAWCGDQGFLMHDPANSGETLQVLAAVRTDETWGSDQWTKEKSLEQMRKDLEPFRELGKACGDLVAEQGGPLQARSVWEHPRASTYNRGHAAILGDAAHAMQPWQAAGAGQAIEDAMVLTTLFSQISQPQDISAALETYSSVRVARTHYAQDMSAENGDITMNVGKFKGLDAAQLKEAFELRWEELWYFDLEKHRQDALGEFERLKGGR
ncbi:hypothetical protein M409DRAFT_60102 [Zasmidium cellare ATCC 36951]|uniref:FAD-binding domain-containing protein n=1 Tax=Zasmidium cellare ATCC 36951 TaxID=1080233 RepID=A0A6A6BZH9_ZASCE|nr:uncharacterized protein M409DRAFT_60102 [Zasmidium cellare ATCC 36951]KAF2160181.1 hypothetical protein M409DRAFT_60102 [Zasmidium cellare ATCC 36951]